MSTKEEITEQDTTEQDWREEVEEELKNVLAKFLPISKTGGWGVKYTHPVVESYENGSVKTDPNKCLGAVMYIQFDFENAFNIENDDK